MTLRQRIKLKKKQRQKVAPVCDFKKVSYLAGIIVEQSSGYRCLCFLLCSLNKTKRFHVSVLLFRNRLQKTSKYGKHRRQTRLRLVCHFFWLFFCFVLFCFVFFFNWFLPHFDLSFDLLLNKCTATWNLFVKSFLVKTCIATSLWSL